MHAYSIVGLVGIAVRGRLEEAAKRVLSGVEWQRFPTVISATPR
jgi:hypothetical protein